MDEAQTARTENEVGYTTGTTAAGAAKLAVRSWLAGKPVLETTIDTPANRIFKISAHKCIVRPSFAAAAVIKNSGADPDITKGVVIYAVVRPAQTTSIKGGAGVGLVTKPGLAVEVGERAINPVPRSQIEEAVAAEIDSFDDGERTRGFEVTIIIPKGRKLAERTMNARLGIIGGLSVLGTTGIVRPMSSKAYQVSLIAQISIARALDHSSVVLVFGNIGKRFATGKIGVPEDAVIEVSNWPTLLASECRKAGIRKILMAGHISKILKVAAGFEDTSHETRFATDIFVEYSGSKLLSASMDLDVSMNAPGKGDTDNSKLNTQRELFESIRKVNTTEEASKILIETVQGREFMQKIASDASEFLSISSGYPKNAIGVIITDLAGDILVEDENAQGILKEMKALTEMKI